MIGLTMTDRPRQKVVDIGVVREAGRLARLVREIAETTEKVFFTDHAVRRMRERGFSDADVYRVLRFGSLQGDPWIEPEGDKACKVVMVRRGDRTAGVITIIIEPDGELVIKTVEWED